MFSKIMSRLLLLIFCYISILFVQNVFANKIPQEDLIKEIKEKEKIDKQTIFKKNENFKRINIEELKITKIKEKNKNFTKAEEEAKRTLQEFLKKNNFDITTYAKKKKEVFTEKTEKIIVFISKNVDKNFIRNIFSQARKQNIEILFVLKGFIDNDIKIKKTITWWIKKTTDQLTEESVIPPLTIDPKLFDKVNPIEVPAFYDQKRKCLVYGDITLKEALEHFALHHCNENFGKTVNIEEINGLDLLLEELAKRKDILNAENIRRKVVDSIERKFSNYSCFNLPVQEKSRKYEVTPVYTLEFDITDPINNRIIYPKGFQYNPLDYVTFTGSIVLIDTNNPLQIKVMEFLKKKLPHPVRIFVTEGDPRKISYLEDFSTIVYANCYSLKRLLSYGVCKSSPCVVTSKGNKFSVHEIGLGEMNTIIRDMENKDVKR